MMRWRQISDDVVVMSYPMRTLGIDFRRNVTLLRLGDGRVVIHSTAPFTGPDIAAIRRFGEWAWLVEATTIHETFAKRGARGSSRFAISRTGRFREDQRGSDGIVGPPPPDWNGEIDVLRINGIRTNEHASD
jgi:hypothetical protein